MTVEAGRKQRWELPPLVLHPFNNGTDAAAVLDSIRLNRSAIGREAPDGDLAASQQHLLRGKYCEFRMLCFIGMDLMRWLRQCADFAQRDELLAGAGISERSFADLLVVHTPPPVGARFESWGVSDYGRILRRAIGINAIFPFPPEYAVLSAEFLENYCAYADGFFACYLELAAFPKLDPAQFCFSLFTSSEYISVIECGLRDARNSD